MRKTLLPLTIALLVIAVGVVYVIGNADRLVKRIIETTGTEVTGTPVRVGAVELSLADRSAVIRDLRIGNPAGFSSAPALSIGEISAQLDPDDYQIVRRVRAGDIDVRVESTGLDTNYRQLQKNVRAYASRSRRDTGADTGQDPVTLTIQVVELEKARAVLVADVLEEPLGFGLDRFRLQGLSGTPAEVTRQIVSQIISRVVSAAALKVLEAQARDKGDDVGAAVSELLEQLKQGEGDGND